MLSNEELNQILIREARLDETLLGQDYSAQILPNVIKNFDEINSILITEDNLIANVWRYRFALQRPVATQLDYWPSVLGNHRELIKFVESVISNHYNHDSFLINFSPSLLVTDVQEKTRFIYASLNYLCLPSSILIHDDNSRLKFIKKLKNYNYKEYLEENERSISEKYEGASILSIALTFHITRERNILYGHESLESRYANNCVFDCLSCHFYVNDRHIQRKKTVGKTRNLLIAKKLKSLFFQWVTDVKNVQIEDIFFETGLNTKGLSLCEQFFCSNFQIWKKLNVPVCLVKKQTIKRYKKQTNALKIVRPSLKEFKNSIHFLQSQSETSEQTKHLSCISNLRLTSKKYICTTCNSRFASNFKLSRHVKACGKSRFLSQRLITSWNSVDQKLKEYDLEAISKDGLFFFMTLRKTECVFLADIVLNAAPDTKVTFTAKSIHDISTQVLRFTNDLATDYKVVRFQNNLPLLAKLSALEPEERIADNNIVHLKQKIKQYLSHIQIFIGVAQSDQIIAKKLLRSLLHIHLQSNDIDTCQIKSARANITQLFLTGEKTGLQFILIHNLLTNLFFSPLIPVKQSFLTFNSISTKVSNDLGIDITSGFINSASHLSKLYFDSQVQACRHISIVSPPKNLYDIISSSCKYGVLQANPNYILPEAHFKSFFELDFTTHYLTILKSLTPFTGSPLHLKREKLEFRLQNNLLPQHTFANIFLHALSNATSAHIQYKLSGREAVIENLPIDALIRLPIPSTSAKLYTTIGINIHGCFYHSCEALCHMRYPPADHSSNCEVCISQKTKAQSQFRPYLWKHPKNFSFENSNHPYKQKTYQNVSRDTQKIDERLKNSQNLDAYISLYICQLIPRWDRPISILISDLQLPLNPLIPLHTTLGHCFTKSVQTSFPLLKHSKITMQAVINHSRNNNLHGLIKLSGFLGKSSQEFLNDFSIFSTLSPKGKMINSNEIRDGLMSTSMLHSLLTTKLNNLSIDFIVTNISELFLWPKNDVRPYEDISSHLMNLIKNNDKNKAYRHVLKSQANMYIGNLSASPKNHPSTLLMRNEDFQDLTQFKDITVTEHLTDSVVMGHFSTARAHFNACHNHFLIVQESRLIFIQMFVAFKTYLDINLGSCNCDGLIAISTTALGAEGRRGHSEYGVLAIDSALRSEKLNPDDLLLYTLFKSKYFLHPFVCPNHLRDYLSSLLQDKSFFPSRCCREYLSADSYPHKLSIRAHGQKGAILAINRSVMVDIISQEPIIKCSGMQKDDFDRIFANTPSAVRESLLPHWSSA